MNNGNATIAVCGKGGVGKTAVTAMLAKAIMQTELRPLLLIDADPASGLVSAVGEKVKFTLTEARSGIINAARDSGNKATLEVLSNRIDYMVMQALVERDSYSLMSMGRNLEKGCFCPANTLLRNAIKSISGQYAITLIDAEAGLEQISRQVTKQVTHYIVVVDGSQRSLNTLEIISDMVGDEKVFVIHNRWHKKIELKNFLGAIPEDETLKEYDRKGLSLWDMPDDSPAYTACREIAEKLISKL